MTLKEVGNHSSVWLKVLPELGDRLYPIGQMGPHYLDANDGALRNGLECP